MARKKTQEPVQAAPDTRHLIVEGDRAVFTNISSRQEFSVQMIVTDNKRFYSAKEAIEYEPILKNITLVSVTGVRFPLSRCQKA